MNFKQLTAFREVMLTGSISEAARILHRSQPAVSAQISSLENDIGIKLFQRKGARVVPNPEAHYLFDEATGILARLETVKRTLESISDLDTGVLRIVSIPGPSIFILPNLIADFTAKRPSIQTILASGSSVRVQRAIATQEYDVGLADFGFGIADESRLIDHEVIQFTALCALPMDDSLAQKEFVHATDLRGQPMAVTERNHPIHNQIRASFDEAGVPLNIRFEVQSFLPMFTFVERRLAYGIVDPFTAESYQQSNPDDQCIVFRPFLPKVDIPITLMSPAHRPLSIVAQAFYETLASHTREIRSKWSGEHI
ncbi:hypothetical protein AB838_02130 [Rhodobacteraceae bacterium (ex Bugula neritina AB1)]|nr:hypothetical protein AB838_02130 [Rhodobacteraceae bacterium (ex Bugula neritina AB1)]